MALRLIGSATTNTNGVASITYTGDGVGKIDIIAKVEDLESNEYELIDAKARCEYISKTSHCTATLSNDVLTLGTDGVDYGFFYFAGQDTVSYPIEVGDAVECTLIEYDGQSTFRLDGTNSKAILSTTQPSFTNLLTGNNKIKIINKGTTIELYIDGALAYTYTNQVIEARKFRFRVENNATIKVKDLIYYGE